MELQAYAKINLYLDVTARRTDGYHDIVSIMQTVDLHDTVSVRCTDGQRCITLRCGAGLPCDERNLAYKAALAYFANDPPCGIEIDIEKRIPMQAGLAGGSADCAAVLRGLNLQFAKYTEQELLALGAGLGADVPFCLVGKTQITRGIGEVLQPCYPMPDCFLVIARGGEGISTPWAYRALDQAYGDFAAQKEQSEQRLARILDAMQKNDLGGICDAMYNVFESVVLHVHEVARALGQDMLAGGAIGAMMSGSGPSIVGIFDREDKALDTCKRICEKGIAAFVCKPVN
ncbi:MAG: 4-(cytidine 5'-diphospho)-2-C-methyl-D-erythritol kinase [Ruminococcaceae bacterium]|nr:4-(cytidine 5'-diphospho)-2-C-methyl-D-erythritol kinase [Oscillospiraceae bacterium]